ncbi:ATP-dependent DNA ligase [Nocardia salmonicida]|uniref:ATP-dependent DNA ligase n=2 Tax=Nocardia salmonicida TaxID=53431 RepID=UPI00368FCC64
MKWDGQRAIARCDETGCRFWSRNLREATDSYPDLVSALAEATAALGDGLLLDGEIVAPDPATGAPSFGRLQRRMHARPTSALLDAIRVEFVVFDVLAVDGVSTMDQPYLARRELLRQLAIERGRIRVPPYWTDFDPAHLLDAAEQAGLEGVIAKRTDSVYRPGTRSRSWIKSPLRRSGEAIVAAWIEGTGTNVGTVGSLVLAGYDIGNAGC